MDANRQSSVLIQWHDPQRLEPHPLNLQIYGEDGYQDLVGSIKEFGILEPLYVKNNIIISGHRRWRAAIEAGLTAVPCVRASYVDYLEERMAVIEHNRYRVKTGAQLYREGRELKSIEAEKANRRQLSGLKQFQGKVTVQDNCPERCSPKQSRDAVAQVIGLGSGRQWDRLEYVGKHAPELLPQIKPDGLSIHAAYKRAKAVNYNTPAVKPIEGDSTILIANEDALSFLKQPSARKGLPVRQAKH